MQGGPIRVAAHDIQPTSGRAPHPCRWWNRATGGGKKPQPHARPCSKNFPVSPPVVREDRLPVPIHPRPGACGNRAPGLSQSAPADHEDDLRRALPCAPPLRSEFGRCTACWLWLPSSVRRPRPYPNLDRGFQGRRERPRQLVVKVMVVATTWGSSCTLPPPGPSWAYRPPPALFGAYRDPYDAVKPQAV